MLCNGSMFIRAEGIDGVPGVTDLMYVNGWNAFVVLLLFSGIEWLLVDETFDMKMTPLYRRVLIFGLSTQMFKRCKNPKRSIAFKLASL